MKRRHCAGIKKQWCMVIIWYLSQLVKKEISNPTERSHSYVRSNDGETSKYNNQQGIHNYWTCQCKSGGSCHLQGGAVALAQGEAAIASRRWPHFRYCLPLPILSSVWKNRSGVCLCRQAVAAWTKTWTSMTTTRWTPDPMGVPIFWGYQRGSFV